MGKSSLQWSHSWNFMSAQRTRGDVWEERKGDSGAGEYRGWGEGTHVVGVLKALGT